jgi:twinkle protein
MAAWLLRPCVVREARMAALPASVFGPVLEPPCILQRPLGIAGPLHGVPALVRAPQGYFELDELPELDPPRAHETGMIGLSEHYKLRLGDFTVITGVPGHGKSSFINEVCCRMAEKHGWRTVFASFEQAPQTDHRRALRTFYAKKLEKFMTPEDIAKADAWIRQHFGFIVPGEDDDVTLEWLLSVLKQAVLRKEARIAVIDP